MVVTSAPSLLPWRKSTRQPGQRDTDCRGPCVPSDPRRITQCLRLSEQPIATSEFLVVDTETNGLGGDSCAVIEVGTVLVGGGELHDRWSSLVRASVPLRRGIRRLTGITQAMLDGAPAL